MNGFKEVGFIYLENHGIPDGTVKNVFDKVSSIAMFCELVCAFIWVIRAESSSGYLWISRYALERFRRVYILTHSCLLVQIGVGVPRIE